VATTTAAGSTTWSTATSCKFNLHSRAGEIATVQFVHGIFSITIVVEFDESVAIFQCNIANTSIPPEFIFNITIVDA